MHTPNQDPEQIARDAIDAVGVTKSLKTASQPLDTKPSIPLKELSDIEAKLSILDKLEEQIENQLTRSMSLRQSILKLAFSGMLVPQDPNDEPASELLKKIKAEKSETSKAKRKKLNA